MLPIKPFKPALLIIFGLLAAFRCSENAPTPLPPETIVYEESFEDFPNPERGFYHYSETRASSYSPLNATTVANYRSPRQVSGANYQVVSTLVFRYFILDSFKNSELSASFLSNVAQDFNTARTAGAKIIVRFTYTVTATAGSCAEGFICPPYGDASKAIVLQHIQQLAPVLTQHADVIACVQMGFIGTWGEQYYTDYFGDASQNDQGKLLDANWQDRFEVLKALLDGTPKSMMVQVRYPQLKQRFIYGVTAPVTSAALTEAEALSGSDKARIGFHNDCFLASFDDFGTYEDYGNSTSPRTTANFTLRSYFSADSKYVVVGGETCSDGYSPQNDCEPAGKAIKEMSDMHYTYLNTNYNNQVNNDWQTGGCMDEIKRRLGYRLVLRKATLPSQAKTVAPLPVSIEIENVGFAAPYTSRPVELVLINQTTGVVSKQTFTTEPRLWQPGSIVLTETLVAPANPGEWDYYLNLPDNNTALATRTEYSIRLGNENVWQPTSGFNKLNHTLKVE
ncbi:MAG: DUF4832 domain-containing protein [Cytophagales bacterium]|nr:DUF4832 domain-containing protein [Cytophagales bacterium]